MTEAPNPQVVETDTLVGVRAFRRAVVAMGSNLGDRLATLQGALDSLADTPGVHMAAVSAVYETVPVGGPAHAGDYLNAVVAFDTTLAAAQLLDRLHAIENAFGRVRGARNAPRTLDLDIVVLGSAQRTAAELTLPHPRASGRAFVLRPWLDVDPVAELPGSGNVADLLAMTGVDGVRRRSDLSLELR